MLAKLKTFLTDFDKPLAPYLISLIFWLGMAFYIWKLIEYFPVVIRGYGGSGLIALYFLLFPLGWRLSCEFLMSVFIRQRLMYELSEKFKSLGVVKTQSPSHDATGKPLPLYSQEIPAEQAGDSSRI